MNTSRSLLNVPLVSRVRRNHALEHATIQIFSQRHRGPRLVGRSSLWGFYIYGDVSTDAVLAAAQEGLRQLRAGQWQIAIHPNCGTNLVVAGTLAGLGAFVALGGVVRKQTSNRFRNLLEWLFRLPFACAAATLGIILAKPLGATLQSHVTTQPDVGDLHIVGVTREERAGIIVHHVRTEG